MFSNFSAAAASITSSDELNLNFSKTWKKLFYIWFKDIRKLCSGRPSSSEWNFRKITFILGKLLIRSLRFVWGQNQTTWCCCQPDFSCSGQKQRRDESCGPSVLQRRCSWTSRSSVPFLHLTAASLFLCSVFTQRSVSAALGVTGGQTGQENMRSRSIPDAAPLLLSSSHAALDYCVWSWRREWKLLWTRVWGSAAGRSSEVTQIYNCACFSPSSLFHLHIFSANSGHSKLFTLHRLETHPWSKWQKHVAEEEFELWHG